MYAFCYTFDIIVIRTVAIYYSSNQIIDTQRKVKGKVFLGQEPPSGSTTTELGVVDQLLAVNINYLL